MRFSRPATIVTAGLLASVSVGALVNSLANAEGRRRVEAALARVPGVHAGSISVEPWTGKVALLDVVATTPGTTFHAGRLVFRSAQNALPALVSAAFADDDKVQADDVEIDAGMAKIHIPHIEATGTSLDEDELKSIVDPSSALSPTERMDKLTADSLVIPEVNVDVSVGEVSEKIAYHDIKLSELDHGKIGSTAIAGGTFSMTGPNMGGPNTPGTAEGTLGALTATNLDLGLYARLITQTRSDPDEPLKTLYDDITFDGLSVKSGDAFSFTIGKVVGKSAKARPFKTSFKEIQEMMPKAPGEKPSPEQTKKMFEFMADVYSSIEVGSTEIDDVSVKANTPPDPTTIAFSRISLSDLADARLGEMAVEGMQILSGTGRINMGKFAIRGFNFKSMLQAVQALEPQDPNPLKNINPRALIPSIDAIELAGIDADVPDPKHQGNADEGARDVFQIGKFEIDGSNYLLGIPTALTATLEHLVASVPTKDPSLAQVVALGYPKVDLSSKIDFSWSEAGNELAVKEISVRGEQMGSVSLKGVIGNITKDAFVGDPAVMQAALLGAVVKEVDVRVEDAGLFDKSLALASRMSNQSPDALRQQYITAASLGIPQTLGDTPAAKAVANAIAKFIAHPKSLEIDAKSNDGLGAADLPLLGDPVALFSKLNVTATAD